MSNLCQHCNGQLEDAWVFCPRCGVHIAREPQAEENIQPEAPPVKGAFSGLYLGLILAPLMIIAGIMLCLTGLGAFLGVPLIIGGIIAPLAGPLFGMGVLRGKIL